MCGCLGQSQALRGPLYERTMKPPWMNSGPDALGASPASVGSDGNEVKATGARLISPMRAPFLSVVDAAARGDARVTLVRAEHAGKGATVRRGMLSARGAWRFLADADLSVPMSELPRFLDAAARGVDILVGSREAKGARRVGEPWLRHAIGRVFNWMVKIVVLRGIDDTQCGFKLFSARAAETLFPLQRLDGFGFDVEILFLARRAGFAIREIPVTWVWGRGSKVNLASGARGFLDLVAVRWNHVRGVYPPRGAVVTPAAPAGRER